MERCSDRRKASQNAPSSLAPTYPGSTLPFGIDPRRHHHADVVRPPSTFWVRPSSQT